MGGRSRVLRRVTRHDKVKVKEEGEENMKERNGMDRGRERRKKERIRLLVEYGMVTRVE